MNEILSYIFFSLDNRISKKLKLQKIRINTIPNGYPDQNEREKVPRKLRKGMFFCSIRKTASLSAILFRFDRSVKK